MRTVSVLSAMILLVGCEGLVGNTPCGAAEQHISSCLNGKLHVSQTTCTEEVAAALLATPCEALQSRSSQFFGSGGGSGGGGLCEWFGNLFGSLSSPIGEVCEHLFAGDDDNGSGDGYGNGSGDGSGDGSDWSSEEEQILTYCSNHVTASKCRPYIEQFCSSSSANMCDKYCQHYPSRPVCQNNNNGFGDDDPGDGGLGNGFIDDNNQNVCTTAVAQSCTSNPTMAVCQEYCDSCNSTKSFCNDNSNDPDPLGSTNTGTGCAAACSVGVKCSFFTSVQTCENLWCGAVDQSMRDQVANATSCPAAFAIIKGL